MWNAEENLRRISACPAPRTVLLEAVPCGKQSAGGIFQVWLTLGVRKQKSPLRLGCALSTLHKARTLPLHAPRCMSVWRWARKIQQGLPFFFSCCLAGNRSSLSKPLKYRSSQHMRIKKRKEHSAGTEQLQATWLKFNVFTLQCS